METRIAYAVVLAASAAFFAWTVRRFLRMLRRARPAHPTDRILSVLQRNDGTQFDQHLVRRFVQLLGVYPPGNLVKLKTGEVAVVLKVHAPDPYRPRVRVLFAPDGARLDVTQDRNLFELGSDPNQTVVAPVDPATYGVDPLTLRIGPRGGGASISNFPIRGLTLSGDVRSGTTGAEWDARVMFDVAEYLRRRR